MSDRRIAVMLSLPLNSLAGMSLQREIDRSARRTSESMTTQVLIRCTHNSARTVLSEGMLNHLAAKLGLDVKAHSADSAPGGRINPFAIEALKGAGIDTSAYRRESWDEFSQDGAQPLSIVITVCDSAAAETCPVFLGGTGGQPVKVHWGYPDPSNAEGGNDAKRRAFELTRQAIGYRMLQLLALPLKTMDGAARQASLTRTHDSPHLGTRQYARILEGWVEEPGLDPANYGTHSIRRTKATLIYRRTKNLRAVQLLLGHSKLGSTVRYLGTELDDALEISEQTEI